MRERGGLRACEDSGLFGREKLPVWRKGARLRYGAPFTSKSTGSGAPAGRFECQVFDNFSTFRDFESKPCYLEIAADFGISLH